MYQKRETRQGSEQKQIWIKFGYGFLILITFVLCFVGIGIWSASNQILFPKWKGITQNFSECSHEGELAWGSFCGNIRLTKEYRFKEITFLSMNGYELPGWLVGARDNGVLNEKGVVLLVHGGGSDRREVTRLIPMFLKEGLDVVSFDLSCHGEAPCVVPGLSFGIRESRDILSAYFYLSKRYQNILMYGNSVGASSLLITLPMLTNLKGIIVENPMISFEKLIFDAPESSSLPKWMVNILIGLVEVRGKFDTLMSPENSLPLVGNVPILFIHSKEDLIVSYQHSEKLMSLYLGPKELWITELGSHGKVWDANSVEYETKVRNFIRKQL